MPQNVKILSGKWAANKVKVSRVVAKSLATILAKEGLFLCIANASFASRIKGGHTTFALRVVLEQVMSIVKA